MSFQQQPGSAKGEVRILVVDDDPVQRQATCLRLLELGFEAAVVSEGEGALKWLEQTPADLVFLDCQMPILDGYALAREILLRDLKPQPILVALTSLDTTLNRQKCYMAGMDDFLAKPIESDALQACLERWLGVSSTHHRFEEEFRPQLIPIFLEDAPLQLQSMRHALENNDAPALERAAHTLKSSSALLGATRLSQGCLILETIGGTGALEGVVETLEKLEAEFEIVCSELQNP